MKNGFVIRFGELVRERRKALGMSQEELSFEAGLHRTEISHIERGTRAAGLPTIEKLAAGLCTQPAELMPSIRVRIKKRHAK